MITLAPDRLIRAPKDWSHRHAFELNGFSILEGPRPELLPESAEILTEWWVDDDGIWCPRNSRPFATAEEALRFHLDSPVALDQRTHLRKVIHLTWEDWDVPEEFYPRVWYESWMRENPDWTIKFWTDADRHWFIEKYYPQYIEQFREIKLGVVRADIVRCLVLHHFGGLYADLDYICLKPITDYLKVIRCSHSVDVNTLLLMEQPEVFVKREKLRRTNALMYADKSTWTLVRAVEDGLDYFEQSFKQKQDRFLQPLQNDVGEVMMICGPARFHQLFTTYGQRSCIQLIPWQLCCPKDPIHDRSDEKGWRYWLDINQLKKTFPVSFAVTSHRGAWWNSKWTQSGTKKATWQE